MCPSAGKIYWTRYPFSMTANRPTAGGWRWCAGDGGGCRGWAILGVGKPITTRLPRRSAHYVVNLKSVAATARRGGAVFYGRLCGSAWWQRQNFL